MKRRLCALLALFSLAGCSVTTAGNDAGAVEPAPAASARSGMGSAKDAGDLPDPCTLLREREVVALTGRQVTQVDRDDARPGTATRFCQWQQEGGQLAVFLTRSSAADFTAQQADAPGVAGIGDDAFALAGHLYVLHGTAQIDVYSRGGDTDEQNLSTAKKVAEALIPRVQV